MPIESRPPSSGLAPWRRPTSLVALAFGILAVGTLLGWNATSLECPPEGCQVERVSTIVGAGEEASLPYSVEDLSASEAAVLSTALPVALPIF